MFRAYIVNLSMRIERPLILDVSDIHNMFIVTLGLRTGEFTFLDILGPHRELENEDWRINIIRSFGYTRTRMKTEKIIFKDVSDIYNIENLIMRTEYITEKK